ncbi:McrB family protein [Acinetobacter sp. P8-3-8]|uniref:McrB family protein n=1 Tax=Acinetobacter sp. P8-3-8 TaxID=1029823 RepID=UPI000248573C|nr:AAA family ATPase [Acinetobacter sp. P8-3-8]
MTSSEKLLALYDEIIVNRYIDGKDAMQEWHDRYKSFIETVQARTVEIKKGKKLDYDNGDQEFLDHFFISNNPVSSRGSNPISDEDLRAILRSNDFIDLIEETMLNPNKKSWVTLIEKGKNIFKRNHFDNQRLRFNRISASCTSNLIPMPSENAFNKFVKYLNDNAILDFTNIEKNWYAQNEYLTKEIHEIFSNKILDENDFTDEYWLNLFAWSLYDKKVNQSESDLKDTETKPNTGTKKMENSLNRILFGAAGTGKTYNTINHALSILDPEYDLQLDRKELKKRFDAYKKQGRIKFVTFHQSFSYEDFVEGIRAETSDDGQLSYDVKAGVFKELCEDAQTEIDVKQNNASAPIEASINSAIDQLIAQAKTEEIIFHTKRGVEIKVSSHSAGTLVALTSTGSNVPLSIRHIRNYLKIQSDMLVDQKSYEWAIANSLRSKVKFTNSVEKVNPYVLIIDEINRGNISRIFGELITLIEDSKRQDAEEQLSVILPYSKKEFSVPNNVYIIGTMNSSDRSLTGLDVALRRRFTFIEMPPKPELLNDVTVNGLNIGKLLEVINQRIEVLLDRDHCIGHANFMSLSNESKLGDLAQIFKQKIIPQLQEYFFDDWAKINMVFNANGMLKSKPVERSILFPNVNNESEEFFEEQKTWQLVDTAFDSIASFSKIITH